MRGDVTEIVAACLSQLPTKAGFLPRRHSREGGNPLLGEPGLKRMVSRFRGNDAVVVKLHTNQAPPKGGRKHRTAETNHD